VRIAPSRQDVRPDQPVLADCPVIPASSWAGQVGGGRGGPPLASSGI